MHSLKLNSTSIFNVPIQNYNDDFTFVVNDTEFVTNQLTADLLSPRICKCHILDPTINTFIFRTKHKGDFSIFLKLINFNFVNIPESELPFISEVVTILENESIDLSDFDTTSNITTNNIFDRIKSHEQCPNLYSKVFTDEINFISSHFYELYEKTQKSLGKLQFNTLTQILYNDRLQLIDEDQLLDFINYLYATDAQYSLFYETVDFQNVSVTKMNEFLSIFDFQDCNKEIWNALSKRLLNDTAINYTANKSKGQLRYTKSVSKFVSNINKPFSGIINFLRKKSNGNIDNEIEITSSSCSGNNFPKNVVLYENKEKRFYSNDLKDSWICFDFKNSRVIPSSYTIRSENYAAGISHPKSWVIEVSNDNCSWEIIDEWKDCAFLNGESLIHTFDIRKPLKNEVRYIRMRQTGPNWYGQNCLVFSAFELYGSLILNSS